MNLRRFWSEWGLTKEEAVMGLGALSVFALPLLARILISLFV